MSAAAVCHVHTAWKRENLELWMSLWTWEIYESFTFFVCGKEYRFKRIEKTNTNVTCNNNSFPVNNCTPKLCLSPFRQYCNDYTHLHYVFISLVILKNRTYLLRPSLVIFQRDVQWHCAFMDIFEFATNKAFDVCIRMSMLFWLGSFLKSLR